MSTPRIDRVVVSGVFSLDGQDFDVDNNVWLVGDDDEVLVIDAPHDAAPIVGAIGGRRVTAIVLTHGHNSLCARDLDTVLTGDTLFCGGPGATGRSSSDEPTISAEVCRVR